MTKNPKKSLKFSNRLNQACDQHPDCPDLHKGRLKWLKDQLSERELNVSIESIRKWLAGEGRPRLDKSELLARVLDVDAVWLFMGKDAHVERDVAVPEGAPAHLKLPIAIRAGHTVEISGLPHDLTQSEARRVANIILAHALGD